MTLQRQRVEPGGAASGRAPTAPTAPGSPTPAMLALEPRRADVWKALAVLTAVTALFFLPLFRGDTFVDVASRQNELYPWAGQRIDRPPTLHYDQSDQYYPWQVFINRALRSGQMPLWNPYSFGGTPFVSNGQNGIFYPPRTVLSVLVAPERVHDCLVVSHMLLGGLTMFLLLRAVRLGFPAALFGAVAWQVNSFMLAWLGLTHYVVVEAWLPLAVLLVLRLFRRRSWVDGVWLGGVLALIFLGGHIMYVLISVTMCAALAGFLALRRAWREIGTHAPRVAVYRAIRANLFVAVPFVVMGGLIAVQLLPMLDLGRESARTTLPYDQFVSSYYRIELGQLLYLFLPPPPGLTRERLHVDAGWLFLGTPTALFALLGLLRQHPLAVFARGVALVVLLVALGTLATWCVYYGLPGFKYFKPVSRVLFLFQFGVAILAAFGLDYLLRRAPRLRRWRWWGGWPARRRTLAAYGALALLVLQMYHLGGALLRHQPATPDYLYPETPLTLALGRDDGTRILPVIPDRDVQQDHPIGRFFYGSTAMVFPLESALGYDNPPDRIANLWRLVHGNTPERILGPPTELDLLRPPDDKAQRIWAFVPTFRVPDVRFDLLPRVGVTDVLTPPYVERDPAWDPARFLPTRLDVRYSGADGRIYHVAEALPRAYLVARCVHLPTQLAVLERFADPAWDPRRAVLLDPLVAPDQPPCADPGEAAAASIGTAEVLTRSLNTVTIRVRAEEPGWLVLNESWDAGWTATVDGAAASVYPGNYAFRTLPVAAGDHTVEFAYQPASFRQGAVISAGALTFVLAVAGWSLLQRYRRGALALRPMGVESWRPGRGLGLRAPGLPASRWLPAARAAAARHRGALAYALLALGVAAYHQWLGARFAVAYFLGETGRALDLAEALAVNLRPDPTALASSASPAGTALYALLLRLFDVAFERPGGEVLQPSVGPLVAVLALLATVVCLLAALLALRLSGSRPAAVVTTILLGLYAPLVVASERGLPELPFVTFLLLTLLGVHTAFARQSLGWGLAAGALFALAVGSHLEWQTGLAALAATLLASATLALLARGQRRAVRVSGAFLVAGFGLLAVWAGVLTALPAERRPPGLDQPSPRRSPFALALTDGWTPDPWYTLQVSEAAPASARAAAALLRGEMLCPGGQRTLLACAALQSPLTTVQQLATNQRRLWWAPYAPQPIDFGPLTDVVVSYHRFLLVAGLLGCTLILRRRPATGTLLAAPIVFVAGWFGLQMADPAATLVALPSLGVGTAALLVALRGALRVRLRWPASAAAGAVATAGLAVALIASLGASASGPRESWSVPLVDSRQRLVQEIERGAPPQPGERFAILLDVQAADGDLSDLLVTLNGEVVPMPTAAGGLVFPTAAATAGEAYRARYEQSPRGWGDLARRPQWVAIPVPAEWVRAGRNEIVVGLRGGGRPRPITIAGQRLPEGEAAPLPALFATSLARYDQEGDARVPTRVALTGRSRTAWYSPDGFALLDDLAPAAGHQGGTYHIFLAVLEAEPLPRALGAREARGRSVAARLDPAGESGPVDSFWLLASELGAARVTIFDRGRPLVAFGTGSAEPRRWASADAEVVYHPYEPADPAFPRAPFEFDKVAYELTPTEAAVTLWYSPDADNRVPQPAVLPVTRPGVYVVRLRQPVPLQGVTVSATRGDEARALTWDVLRQWAPAPTGSGGPTTVLAEGADGAAQYLGNPTRPVDQGPTAPTLFIVHGGDLVPTATLAAAARLRGEAPPATRLVPSAAPLSYPAIRIPGGGTFSSYWAPLEQAGVVELPPAMVRLE